MREMKLLIFLKKGFFPMKIIHLKQKKKESEEESEEESEKEIFKKFIEYIENESKGINYELFKNYFDFVVPSALAKELFKIKDKKKNNELVNLIKIKLSDLKDEIKKMSKDETQNERPDEILNIVEEILEFNKKI